MRIAITTMMYKRHNIFEMFAKNFVYLRDSVKPLGIELICVCAGSDGKAGELLCEKYGIHYKETPNKPLGRKANLRLAYTRTFNPEYVIFLGSDDMMSLTDLLLKIEKIREGYEFIAPMDIYFLDSNTKRALYAPGYKGRKREGENMAVGRCISSKILDNINWVMFNSKKNIGLDGSSNKILSRAGKGKAFLYWHSEGDTCIYDVKSDVGMSTFGSKQRRHKPDKSNKWKTHFSHLD